MLGKGMNTARKVVEYTEDPLLMWYLAVARLRARPRQVNVPSELRTVHG